jgi:hypothetical protein
MGAHAHCRDQMPWPSRRNQEQSPGLQSRLQSRRRHRPFPALLLQQPRLCYLPNLFLRHHRLCRLLVNRIGLHPPWPNFHCRQPRWLGSRGCRC